MNARPALPADGPEVLRLARTMFATMEADLGDDAWEHLGGEHFRTRLGDDLAVFVIDHPAHDGRLIASAAGTIARRLPTPFNRHGLTGYVQWVCTDAEYRGGGLGARVMTSLLDWYETRDITTVELHATPVAESLYRKLGFDDTGMRALRRS